MVSIAPVAILKSDTVDQVIYCRSIACDAAGTVTLVFRDAAGTETTQQFSVDPATNTNVIPWDDFRIVRVNATGTSLSNGQMHGTPL